MDEAIKLKLHLAHALLIVVCCWKCLNCWHKYLPLRYPTSVFQNVKAWLIPAVASWWSVLLRCVADKSSSKRGVTGWKGHRSDILSMHTGPVCYLVYASQSKNRFKFVFLQLWGIFALKNSTASVSWWLKNNIFNCCRDRTLGKLLHRLVFSCTFPLRTGHWYHFHVHVSAGPNLIPLGDRPAWGLGMSHSGIFSPVGKHEHCIYIAPCVPSSESHAFQERDGYSECKGMFLVH